MDFARSAASSLESGIDRLLNRRITLGVTGFSGSGKTTLITSLIHQLQHYPGALLAAFPPVLQDRLLGVQLLALDGAAPFPYQRGVEALSRGRWPDATRDESGCLLEIRFRNRPGLLRRENRGSVVCIWRFVTPPESGCWICRYWQWITVPGVLNATPSLTVPCVCLLAGVLSKS